MKVGIADQKPDVFSDARFAARACKHARRSVAWDTMQYDWQVADIDAWMTAARAAGVTPLITFARSRIDAKRHMVPTAARRPRRVRGVPRPLAVGQASSSPRTSPTTRRADRPPPEARARSTTRRSRRPARAARSPRRRSSTTPNLVSWAKQFVKHAGKKQPKLLGAAQLLSAPTASTRAARALLRHVKGEIWVTEVGGWSTASRRPGKVKLPEGVPHATKVTRYIFTKHARSARASRASTSTTGTRGPDASWDSGLIDQPGKARPSLGLLEKALGRVPSNQLPTAKPNTPTPVGPADGVLPSI